MTDKPIPEELTMPALYAGETRKAALRTRNGMRRWVTPFAMGAFLLTALTGMLLFFKVPLGLVKPVHEWLSWLLVAAVALHLFINWQAGMHTLTRTSGKAVLLAFVLLLGLSLLPLGSTSHHHGPEVVTRALIQAPLDTVARLANHNPDDIVIMLMAEGINVESKGHSLERIAEQNNRPAMELLGLIFY